jgi:hypothetical protein
MICHTTTELLHVGLNLGLVAIPLFSTAKSGQLQEGLMVAHLLKLKKLSTQLRLGNTFLAYEVRPLTCCL